MNKPETIAAIVAITQVFKYYGVPSKFCPALAILLGAAFGYSENQTVQGIIDGVILGAITTGSYGVIKGAGQSVLRLPKKEPADNLEHDDDRCV